MCYIIFIILNLNCISNLHKWRFLLIFVVTKYYTIGIPDCAVSLVSITGQYSTNKSYGHADIPVIYGLDRN
jgi:hypothetical protein